MSEGAYLLERIRSRCVEDGDCLMWQGATDSSGTPLMRLNGSRSNVPVRRVVLQAIGKWSGKKNHVASNVCCASACVSEEHAREFSRSYLIKRAAERTGYHLSPVRNAKLAAAHRNKKLDDPALREAIKNSPLSTRALAREYGVSQTIIWMLVAGHSYKQYGGHFQGLGARA